MTSPTISLMFLVLLMLTILVINFTDQTKANKFTDLVTGKKVENASNLNVYINPKGQIVINGWHEGTSVPFRLRFKHLSKQDAQVENGDGDQDRKKGQKDPEKKPVKNSLYFDMKICPRPGNAMKRCDKGLILCFVGQLERRNTPRVSRTFELKNVDVEDNEIARVCNNQMEDAWRGWKGLRSKDGSEDNKTVMHGMRIVTAPNGTYEVHASYSKVEPLNNEKWKEAENVQQQEEECSIFRFNTESSIGGYWRAKVGGKWKTEDRANGFRRSVHNGALLEMQDPVFSMPLDLLLNFKPNNHLFGAVGMDKDCGIQITFEGNGLEPCTAKHCADPPAKGEMHLKKDNVVKIYPTFWFFADAWYLSGNKTGDCADWNSAVITICYDGLLDPTQNWQEDLALPNAANNAITKFCKQKQPNGSHVVRHGFAVGACASLMNFTAINNGSNYESWYRINFNITLSYSNESYPFNKVFPVRGNRKDDGSWKLAKGPEYQRYFTIKMGSETSIYAVLSIPGQKGLDFASEIEMNRFRVFREIAKRELALGLLGRDLIPRLKDDENQDWAQSLQYSIAPKPRCSGSLDVLLNEKSQEKKLKCLTGRLPNYCDRLGWDLFKRMADGKRELEQMDDECARCNGDNGGFPPLPANISHRMKPRGHQTPYTGPPFTFERKKRSLDQFKNSKLVPKCDEAEDDAIDFYDSSSQNIVLLETDEILENLKAKRKNCCNGPQDGGLSEESNNKQIVTTTESMKAHRRRKRQLHIDESRRWNATIPYRFVWPREPNPEKQAEWEEEIRKGLDHISNFTCLQFVPATSVDSDHLIFVKGYGCNHRNHIITIGSSCEHASSVMKIELWAIVAHEVCHGLGFTHEHQRSDRDQHIWVNPKVVGDIKDDRSQFVKKNSSQAGLPYDFSSLMHYEAFHHGLMKSKNEPYAMISLEEPFQQSMVRTNLSFKDIKMLNQYYCTKEHPFPAADSCDWNTPMAKSCQNGGFLDPKQSCKKCRCPPGLEGELCTELEMGDPGCGKTELVATPKSQILMYKSTADSSAPHRCIWRIKKNPANANQLNTTRISIEFIENGFQCTEPCEEWLELKYKIDKTANGAHVCCNFTTESGDKMPVITVEEYETEMLLLLYDPLKRANFKISYKAGYPKIKAGKNCSVIIVGQRRNPGIKYVCEDIDGVVIPCEKQSAENAQLACKHYHKMEINGIEVLRDGTNCTELSIKELRKMSLEEYHDCQRCTPEVIKRDPKCMEITRRWCLETDEGDQWYWKNAVGDLIRLSSDECRIRNDDK